MSFSSAYLQENDIELTQEDYMFYGDSIKLLEGARNNLTEMILQLRKEQIEINHSDPVDHYKSRIKNAKHMQDKLHRYKLPETLEAALYKVYDAIGFRVVCTFMSDIYIVCNWFRNQTNIKVINEKDYIKSPKPSGYRSYHMIIEIVVEQVTVYAEIQIRTLAMDCWASLEHKLKYKHEIRHQEMMVTELKRCADEIASTDLNLEAIKEIILEDMK